MLMPSKDSPSGCSLSLIFLSTGIWPFPRIWSTLIHTRTHTYISCFFQKLIRCDIHTQSSFGFIQSQATDLQEQEDNSLIKHSTFKTCSVASELSIFLDTELKVWENVSELYKNKHHMSKVMRNWNKTTWHLKNTFLIQTYKCRVKLFEIKTWILTLSLHLNYALYF